MFFWNSLAFSMIQQMLAIWSLVPLPFLKPACRRLRHCSTPLLFYPRMRKAESTPNASCWLGGPGPSPVLWTPCIHRHVSLCIPTSTLSAVTNQLVLLSIHKLGALLFERGSQVALVAKNPPADASRRKRPGFGPWVGKIPWLLKRPAEWYSVILYFDVK